MAQTIIQLAQAARSDHDLTAFYARVRTLVTGTEFEQLTHGPETATDARIAQALRVVEQSSRKVRSPWMRDAKATRSLTAAWQVVLKHFS